MQTPSCVWRHTGWQTPEVTLGRISRLLRVALGYMLAGSEERCSWLVLAGLVLLLGVGLWVCSLESADRDLM